MQTVATDHYDDLCRQAILLAQTLVDALEEEHQMMCLAGCPVRRLIDSARAHIAQMRADLASLNREGEEECAQP